MKILLLVPSFYYDRRSVFIQSFNNYMSMNFPNWVIDVIDTRGYDEPYMCMFRTNIRVECDYVMQCDDDFIWNQDCVKYYKRVEKILEEQQPAVLNVFGSRYPRELFEIKNCMIGTNRGLFIKTKLLEGVDWHNDIKNLKYGLEESVLAFKALESGGKFMVIGQSPLERTHKSGSIGYDNHSKLHNLALIEENCIKFIRKRYDDATWDFQTGNFPKGLKMNDAKKTQIGGNHYSKLAIQPFDYCHKNHLEGAESAVIAYVTRHRDKGKAMDLKKAIHTLELLLDAEYGEKYDRRD